jgi:hypothetical protein
LAKRNLHLKKKTIAESRKRHCRVKKKTLQSKEKDHWSVSLGWLGVGGEDGLMDPAMCVVASDQIDAQFENVGLGETGAAQRAVHLLLAPVVQTASMEDMSADCPSHHCQHSDFQQAD